MAGLMPIPTFAGNEKPGALKLNTAFAATQRFGRTGAPAEVAAGAVVVDAHRLRLYGAKLDGTDDAAAVQAAIADAARWCPAAYVCPSIVVDIPAGAVLGLSSTVDSGAYNLVLTGAGPFVSEIRWLGAGGVMWQHGTAAAPAVGYLHVSGLLFRDGTPAGSGATGLSVYMGQGVLQKCLTIEAMHFRHWVQPVRIINCQRGPSVWNVSAFAPDYALIAGPAFEIGTDAVGTWGSFDGSYTDVMTVGYTWGWRFSAANPIEGQSFTHCNTYNGWGLVQVNVTAGGGYKSLLWSFTDCDGEGLGFYLDLNNCRQVTVRGGFWILKANTAGLPAPNGAPRRRYMSFKGTENIRLRDLELDVKPGQEASLSLIHVDAQCQDVKIDGTIVRAFSNLYAFVEAEPNARSNTVVERDTSYTTWGGGTKILDPGGNQACETTGALAVFPAGHSGTVRLGAANTGTGSGGWTITAVTGAITVDNNGQVYVAFPTRPGGAPFFLGGAPSVVPTSRNSNTFVPAPSTVSISATGFLLQFPSGTAGVALAISYIATGI